MQKLNSKDVTVNIVDSIMGSGKTKWVLDKIANDTKSKYIMVTPTLSEIDRIMKQCPGAKFKEPEIKVHKKKYLSLQSLVKEGENIVTTHSLFDYLNDKILADIKSQNYTLVIDEALSCVELYEALSPKDLKILLQSNTLFVEPETFRLRWNSEAGEKYYGKFHTIKQHCDNSNLIYYKEKTLFWEFPIELLRAFKDIWAMTYMFRGSTMANYMEADGVNIVMHSLKGKATKDITPKLIPYDEADESEIKEQIRALVTLYDGKANDIGESLNNRHNPLSHNWYRKKTTSDTFRILNKNLKNFFYNFVVQGKAKEHMWTLFKDCKSKIYGKGYSKGYVTNNIKATNDYIDRKNVAYLQNTFYHQTVKLYFTSRNVHVYDDLWSLSEMIQFIWRTQIRRLDPVILYIPSSRMRHLFVTWLNTDNSNELFKLLKIDQNDQV